MTGKPRPRKTKIIATIGPASDSLETLQAMIEAGMNVARLNLSHGTFGDHRRLVERIREAAARAGANVSVMLDTRGIEIRTGKLAGGRIDLEPGDSFALYTDQRAGDVKGVSVTYQRLPQEVERGTPVLLDDGVIELEVEATTRDTVHCRVVHGGRLGASKGVNLPGTELAVSAVSPENRDDVVRELTFAVENDVDYVAASFVQTADDVNKMREILLEQGVDIPIIAKIENRAGVKNLEQIVSAANGIMVARGDLGVELPLADVPSTQKKIIRTTVMNGKPVITATQMLASMELNPKPTRAEASDVANAILDGSSAVMLSGETAVGRYPVEVVRTMVSLALRAEASLREYGYLQKILPDPSHVVTEAVSQAAVNMATHLRAAAIFSLTETGFTSRLISKHRPDCPILAVTGSKLAARRLAMNWGVIPLLCEGKRTDEAKIAFAVTQAGALGYVGPGDVVVATAGHKQQAGGTDLLRVITLGE
jgi:pyruvate kinase